MVLMELLDRFLLPKTVKSVEEIRNVRLSDSLRANLLFFKVLGHWMPEKGSVWFVPYAVYSAFMFLCLQIMWNMSLFIKCYLISGDLEAMAASVFIASGTGMEIIKACCLLVNRYEIGGIVRSLDCEAFKPKSVRQFELVADSLRFSQLIYLFFLFSVNLTISLWAMIPILDSTGKRLPFNAWFPWDVTKSPVYELCYAYQISGIFILGLINCSFDSTVSGLMSNICAQLDLLSHKLESIYDETEYDLGKSSVSPRAVCDAMNATLAQCIEHHRNILKLAAGVERVFSFTVFCQFMIIAATFCMTMFQLTMVRPLSVEFISLLGYQICANTEIAMYCGFGNEVMLRSQKVLQASFNVPWESGSVKFRKNLLFFMLRLSKPTRIRAGGYFVLSLQTFTWILRSSWSYFAVLRQVHGR